MALGSKTAPKRFTWTTRSATLTLSSFGSYTLTFLLKAHMQGFVGNAITRGLMFFIHCVQDCSPQFNHKNLNIVRNCSLPTYTKMDQDASLVHAPPGPLRLRTWTMLPPRALDHALSSIGSRCLPERIILPPPINHFIFCKELLLSLHWTIPPPTLNHNASSAWPHSLLHWIMLPSLKDRATS